MKKFYITSVPILALFIFCTAFVSMKYHSKSSNGILSQNGSPGEGTCSGCHGGGSSAGTSISITATPSFTNNEFVQGQTYTISIIVSGSAYTQFGFSSEILTIPTNTNAGLMQNNGPGVSFATGGNGRRNAFQNTPKIAASGSATFTYQWVAPNSSNNVKIFAVGNCVNGNGNTNGDFVVQSSLTLTTPAMASVREQNKNAVIGFNVFPNPATEKLVVSYGLMDPKNVTIQLMSITGEVIALLLDEKQDNGFYTKNLTIPSTVAKGVYFVKVMTDNEKILQRLLVVN